MSFQQHTVEYQVPVGVDGITPAPALSFDPASPDFKEPDSDGIVRFTEAEMQTLTGGLFGLFDPDFGVGGTFADRFIHMIQVRTSGGSADARISVVDARDVSLSGQQEVLAPSAEANFYKDNGVFVPQGSAIGFAGFTPSAGNPVVIRIQVVVWGSVEDYADLLRSVCCLGPVEGTPTLKQVLIAGNATLGRNIVISAGDNINFENTFLVDNSMQPIPDNVYGNGALDARWTSLVSRMSLAVSLTGDGTTQALYGANSVGIVHGTADAALTGTARLQLADPASPEESSLGVRARTVAAAGGLAEAFASGAGSKVSGAVEAFSANNARLRATGIGSEVSGYVGAIDYDSIMEATGIGARASGYAKSYSAPYGAVSVRSVGKGSRAAGAALYFANIYADGDGAIAEGLAFGLGSREAEILASGGGSRAQGMAAGGKLLASGQGSMVSGYAKRGDGAYPSSIEATGRGSAALGVVDRDVGAGPAKVSVTNDGSFAFGIAYGPNSLLEVRGQGSFGWGVTYSYADTAVAEIIVGPAGAANGAFAGGFAGASGAYTSRISAEDAGAFAMGKASASLADTYIQATGEGGLAHGKAEGASILANADGAFAQGAALGNDISASAAGAFAHGDSTNGDILASAANAAQFGPGSNARADTLQVGTAGLAFKGTALAPGSLQNGDFWIDVSGNVYCRTNGVSKNLSNIT
jgi:hypothetical protein